MMEPHEWKAELDRANAALSTPEYAEYHRKVVEEGVRQHGEESRFCWEQMSYELQFIEGTSPEECVEGNFDAMDFE